MSTLWQSISSKMLRSSSKLYLLMGINIIVYLAINIPAVIMWLLTSDIDFIPSYAAKYLALPASLPILLHHFWTPITYMFMHDGPLHILFNMLWLYWFGRIFEEFSGTKRTIGLYLMGGLSGAIFYVVSYNIFPAFTNVHAAAGSIVVGASASVMAIIVATGTLLPNYLIPLPFIGSLKLKWIVLIYVGLDFISIAGPNSGGEIAHIGGALLGFVYIKRLQKGSDWIANISNLFKSGPKLSKLRVVARNTVKRSASKPRQEDVDTILDKISTSGYESLSKEEKEILFRASKNES